MLRAGSQSALTRRVGDELELLSHSAPEAWGLRARSKEQRFALELLLDPAIEVVALDGRAGTGKTLLAVAAGLEQVVEHGRYERLAVYRPLVPVGRADVGFLPGGLDEKLDPWMAAIHDAVVALTDHGSNTDARRLIDELTGRGQLSLESVTFLRGRSLQRQMVVIDEAQNLEPTTLRRSSPASARAPRSCSPATRARSTRRTSASRTTPSPCSPRPSAASPASATSR